MGSTLRFVALLTLLTMVLLLVGGLVGGISGAIVALALAVILDASAYWFSDRLVLRMTGASEISASDAPDLFRMVEGLARAAGIPTPRLYVIESVTPNAFATGRDPAHAAIALTAGIVSALGAEELAAVLAHEIAHIRGRDTLLSSVVASVAGAVTGLAALGSWSLLAGRARDDEAEEEDRGRADRVLAGGAAVILAPVAAAVIQGAISREREYAADSAGAQILGDPLPLASALEKLDAANREAPLEASPALAHQFVVQPFVARGLASLFQTHPPVEERAARLRSLALHGAFSPVRF
jgi:heat shock protein HtpX